MWQQVGFALVAVAGQLFWRGDLCNLVARWFQPGLISQLIIFFSHNKLTLTRLISTKNMLESPRESSRRRLPPYAVTVTAPGPAMQMEMEAHCKLLVALVLQSA